MSVTTFTRLASANSYDNALRNLQGRQTALANLQESLTSGKKITSPSDDPTGAAQAERALNRIARISTDQRALEAQRNAIQLAESTLGQITDAMQNFRELVINSNNGSFTPAERSTIAGQLSGLRDQILSLANANDSNGLPLFASLGSQVNPFVGPTPSYDFKGLAGQTGSGQYAIPLALDGESAFMLQPSRDGVFNAKLNNIEPATSEVSPIPNERKLITDNIVITNRQAIADTADLAQAQIPPVDFPKYTVTFSNVVQDASTGMTTGEYLVVEDPPVTAGGFTAQPFSYKTGEASNITISDIPGMTFTVKGVPPASDKALANTIATGPANTVVGSPANNDTVTIEFQRSVFSVLDEAINGIGKAENPNAAVQAIGQALKNMDTAMSRIAAVRGQAGDLLGRADRITSSNEKRTIEQEANRSRAEDLDMIKGVSDFQNLQTSYSAALQSYAQVQKLSLFNFIG